MNKQTYLKIYAKIHIKNNNNNNNNYEKIYKNNKLYFFLEIILKL
jgi:hypothetical protein